MAKKKTKVSKSRQASVSQFETETSEFINSGEFSPRKSRLTKWNTILAVVFVLVLGAWAFKNGMIVSAMVNGKPIFRWQLTKTLVSRFGQQTLESMITERLIADAAAKDGVVIAQGDVDKKVNEIVKSLGENVNLEELLKYQGMSKADFEHQIRLQLTVEKILSKDISIEEKDVDAFIAQNRQTMSATEEGALREEARTAIFSQKVSEKIQPWLAELKNKASITKLLQ